MDAEGIFPAISRISGSTVRRFFETGYTSQMPGTEADLMKLREHFHHVMDLLLCPEK